jgi:DNA-binding GntR family transcriptional regulator
MAGTDVPRWDPESDEPGYLYLRLADHIAARITAGELRPNAMLPNEREMVPEYGVSIDTVRRAVAELRARGLVVTFPSKGTYVVPAGHEQGTS